MKNPFLTYGYAGPEYFCDRKKETERLTTLLRNGNHIALISPRRMGKTGLIKHCFAQPEIKDEYYTFIVDIYATTSLAQFTYKLGFTILNTLKSKERRVWEKFLMAIGSLRQGITLDDFGKPSWNIELGDIKRPEISLDEIFKYLSEADKPCIVAIDEFQAICNYENKNVEALLRTYIQDCNNAWFVFSGSKRHMMNEMFSSPSHPFYQSASILPLKPIEKDIYADFITSHFESNRKSIVPEAVSLIYDMVNGTTWYIQKICNELFAYTDKAGSAGIDDIYTIINNILEENTESYQYTMSRLTAKQSQLLIALSKEGVDIQPTSESFIKKYNLSSASSIQRGLSALIDKDILTLESGRYYIYDYFFHFWLRQGGNV